MCGILLVKLDVGHLDLYMEKWSEPVWPKHGDVVQNDSYMGIKSMSCDITSCTDSQTDSH